MSLGARLSQGLFGNLAKSAAVAGAAVGLALGAGVVAAGVGLFKLGQTFDSAFDQIRVSTGKTGVELGNLKDSFDVVFKSVPASAGDVSEAISTLSVKLGLTGKPLEEMSKQVLNLSHITGTDLKTNLESTGDVFNSFGIAVEDQPKKLDELFRTTQLTGAGFGELSASMAKAGPNLKQLGLNFEQSSALLGLFSKAGLDVGEALPFMSKTIVNAAKAGKDAGDVFRETFDSIKNAPTATLAADAAIDVFGAKAGPKLAGLIREGKLSYDELAKSIADGTDTINSAAKDTADFSEKWQVFKNQVLVGLEPLATATFNAIGTAMEKLGPKVGPVLQKLSDAVIAFFQAFQKGAEDLGSSGFVGEMSHLGDVARDVFDKAWQAVNFFVVGYKGAADDVAASGFNATIKDFGKTVQEFYDWLKVKIPEAIVATKATLGELIDFVAAHQDAFTVLAAGAAAFAAALKTTNTAAAGFSSLSSFASLAAAGGPITLVAAAVVALGVAAVVAYQKFKPFHDAVDKINDIIPGGLLLIGTAILSLGAAAVVAYVYVKPFHDAVDAVGRAIAAVAEAVYNAVGPIISFGATVGGVFGTVKDVITGVAGAISDFLQPAIDWIGQNVGPTIAEGFGAAEAIFARVRDAIQITANVLGVVLPIAAQVLGTVFGPVLKILEVSFKLIGTAVKAVWDIFVGFLGFAIPIWNTFARIVADVVVAAFEQVKATVEEVLGIFRGFFQIIKGIFSGDWSQVWEGVKQIFSSAWGFIIDTVKNFVTLILQILTDIDWSGFLSAFGRLGIIILEAFGNLIVGILQWIGSIVGIFAGLPSLIVSALGDFAGLLLTKGAELIAGLYNAIVAAIPAVTGFFTGLPGQILSWIGDLASWLTGKGGDLIQGLWNGLNNLIGIVSSFFQNLPTDILNWIGSVDQWLAGKGHDFLNGLKSGIDNAVGAVTSFFNELPGNVVTWIGNTLSTLESKGGDVIQGFINGIENWMSSIAGHISSIPDHVRRAIGDLSGTLYAKGQEIIEGLISGVESLAGRAESAVQRVVSAAARSIPVAGQIIGLVDALAAGGIVTRPTFALVGESGPEAVIPLSMFNSGVMPLPSTYSAGMPAPAMASSGGNVTVNAQTNADAWQIASEVRWAQKTAGV